MHVYCFSTSVRALSLLGMAYQYLVYVCMDVCINMSLLIIDFLYLPGPFYIITVFVCLFVCFC